MGVPRATLAADLPAVLAALLFFVATTWGLDRLGLHGLHDGGHSLELDSPGELSPAQWVGNVTLTETWRPRVWRGPSPSVFTRVGWSLCFEEQFYLVCFASLLVAPRRLFGVLAWTTAAIVGYRVFAYDSGWLYHLEGTFIYLWHEFAAGLAVYWRLVWATSRQEKHSIDAALLACWPWRGHGLPLDGGCGGVRAGLDRPPGDRSSGRSPGVVAAAPSGWPAVLQHLPGPSAGLHRRQRVALQPGHHRVLAEGPDNDPHRINRRGRDRLGVLRPRRVEIPQPASKLEAGRTPRGW